MIRSVKRAVIVSVLSALLLSMLAGCSTETSKKTVQEGAKADGKKTKIVVWIWEDAKKILDLNMDAFRQAYPDIDVDLHVLGQDDVYKNFLISASSGDELPDVVTLETLR
ncbi:hypothetical protein [Gordoniibacillus kamchatkensis]|uniref:hypothetical protein n=1 Tax=Gordoniibacillus kamchatkensis TaxID=1590651 RepID=UPI00069612B7|nr:hypothetical protein [Paenibacillus sp. VKM B-2647]